MGRRRSSFHRWADIGARTLHLLAVTAAFVEAVTPGQARGAEAAVILTGSALVASDLWRHGADWLRWVQAWLLIGKLAVFVIAAALGAPLWGLIGAVVLGSVASHAPGEARHRALWGSSGPCATCQPEPRST